MTVLDQLWSQVVRAEMGPLCLFRCGRLGSQSHHVLRRTRYPQTAVKYEPDFGVWVCLYCHERIERTDGYESVLAALADVDPVRLLAIIEYQSSPVEFARAAETEQRAYLRRRLSLTQHNWVDLEVDYGCQTNRR